MYLRKRAFHAVLRSFVSFIGRRAEAPLDHMRLRAAAGRLELDATDGTTWLRAWVPCEGHFDAVLPARALLDFVSGADRDAVIEFVADAKRVDVAFELCLSSFESRAVSDFPPAPDEVSALVWSVEAEWDAVELRK